MRKRFPFLLGALMAVAVPATAGESPVVVELYTSQGCSSCPPADAILRALEGRRDVLPLALHVDYWDYIGWKDTFASPAFADRQRAYAAAMGERTIYTPQLIVGGTQTLMGARPGALDVAIAAAAVEPDAVTLRLSRTESGVRVSATPQRELPGGLWVQVVRVNPGARIDISRGENAGRSIVYSAIVTAFDRVAVWDGQDQLTLTLAVPGPEDVAVIVQEPGPGRILAAARIAGMRP